MNSFKLTILISIIVCCIGISLCVGAIFHIAENYPCRSYEYGETTFENLDIGTNQPDYIGPVNRQ